MGDSADKKSAAIIPGLPFATWRLYQMPPDYRRRNHGAIDDAWIEYDMGLVFLMTMTTVDFTLVTIAAKQKLGWTTGPSGDQKFGVVEVARIVSPQVTAFDTHGVLLTGLGHDHRLGQRLAETPPQRIVWRLEPECPTCRN